MDEVKFPRHEETLPLNFVNAASLTTGAGEFFLTLGFALPRHISTMEDLKHVDDDNARATFRCVIGRDAMKQIINLLQDAYNLQTRYLEGKEGEG